MPGSTRNNTADQLAKNLSALTDALDDGSVTIAQALSDGYAPLSAIAKAGGANKDTMSRRMARKFRAGLLERVKVKDVGRQCEFAYRPKSP